MNSVVRFTEIATDEDTIQEIAKVMPDEQPTHWTTMEGTPFPLGATWVEQAQAWNFAL